MSKGQWYDAFQCRSCGVVFNNPTTSEHGPCHSCGAKAGYTSVTIRKVGWWRSGIEVYDGDSAKPTAFHRRVAEFLCIDADGGDDPAAVVASAMREAASMDVSY